MARPAECAKQYSRAADLAGLGARDRAGMVTGTAACSPSCAVSRRLPAHAVAPSVTASCAEATMVTVSVPHSTCAGPARNGLEVYTSHRPELVPEDKIRGAGGALTVTVLVSCCGPVSWTTRVVRAPGGTGTRTVAPAADQWPAGPPPSSDTAIWLRARTCSPAVPAGDVTWIVTVFEAGDSTHPSRSGTGAGPDRPRHPATTATSDRAAMRTIARRNLYRPADGRAGPPYPRGWPAASAASPGFAASRRFTASFFR